MPIPLRQNMRMSAYLFRQKVTRREKFPLIVELEPLFSCNLACPGCGKIQYPTEILRKRLSVEEAIAAVGRLPELDRAGVRRQFEKRFTARRMAEDYLRVYERLIHARRPFLRAVGE